MIIAVVAPVPPPPPPTGGVTAPPPPPPDRPPEDGKLPPGWISYFDETSGAPYYINEHTQESTWTKPQAAAYAAKPKKFSIKGNRELGVLRDEVQVEMHS